MTEQYEIQSEKHISVLINFLCLSQISRGFKVFKQNSRLFQGSRSQNKFQAFQGFQGAVGTLDVLFLSRDINKGVLKHYKHSSKLYWTANLLALRKQVGETGNVYAVNKTLDDLLSYTYRHAKPISYLEVKKQFQGEHREDKKIKYPN